MCRFGRITKIRRRADLRPCFPCWLVELVQSSGNEWLWVCLQRAVRKVNQKIRRGLVAGLDRWIRLVGQSDTRRTDENMKQDGVSHFGSVFFTCYYTFIHSKRWSVPPPPLPGEPRWSAVLPTPDRSHGRRLKVCSEAATMSFARTSQSASHPRSKGWCDERMRICWQGTNKVA